VADVRAGFDWVLAFRRVLANKKGRTARVSAAATAARRVAARTARPAARLAGRSTISNKVTRSYWPGLFAVR